MTYFDALMDRLRERADGDFDRMVVAVQTGYIIARDPKAARRWSSRRRSGRSGPEHSAKGLSGAGLERAVMSLARRFPEYVVAG